MTATRRMISVAGARIEVDLDGIGPELMAVFDAAWADAVAPGIPAPDSSIVAREHLAHGVGALASAIRGEAREILRHQDTWVAEATLLIDERRAVVVLSDSVEVLPVGTSSAGGLQSLGTSVVSMDPHGALRFYRGPVRVQHDADQQDGASHIRPSLLDGRISLPNAVRTRAIVLVERSNRAETVRLNLEESISAIAERSVVFGGSRKPLATLARILTELGGVILIRYVDPADIADAVDGIDALDLPAASSTWSGRMLSPYAEDRGTGDVREQLFRSGPVDAVHTAEGQVILLRRALPGDEIIVLRAEEVDVWRGASGASTAEILAGVAESARRVLPAAVKRLEDQGLISHEVWWRIADDVVWAEQDPGTVVLNLASPGAAPMELSASARSVWQILAKHLAVSQVGLLDELTSQYGVAAEAIAEDVAELVDSLWRKQFIARI